MTTTVVFKGSGDSWADASRKYRGLLSEYMTLKERWIFASRVLENSDILPEVFDKGGLDSAMAFYSNLVGGTRKDQHRFSQGEACSIWDMRFGLENIARMVSLIKSGFFQRTDSMNLPYIIAGVPMSPERTWGNELYLVAADKLVRNYLQYLNIEGTRWDRFVSWSEYRREQGSLRGGHYIPFRNTFHLVLSMDIKYNPEGLLILAHELGHAACQANVDKMGKAPESLESYTVVSNALLYTYHYRKKLKKILEDCHYQKGCPLRYYEKILVLDDQQKFVEEAAKTEFAKCLFECLVDIIAVQLAGTSYVQGMINYAFQAPVRHEYPGGIRLQWNQEFFIGVFLRASMLFSYLSMRSEHNAKFMEYRSHSEQALDCLSSKSKETLRLLLDRGLTQKHSDYLEKCMRCVYRVAALLGPRFGKHPGKIFGEVFKSRRSPAPLTNDGAIQDLLAGKTLTNLEPRIILDSACKALSRTKTTTLPAAIYSLAFNEHEPASS